MAASANLDFFAAEVDQRAVLDFLFASTDVRVFESYSEYDADLREFRSTDELAAVFPIGIDRHGNGTAVCLELWSPSVMRRMHDRWAFRTRWREAKGQAARQDRQFELRAEAKPPILGTPLLGRVGSNPKCRPRVLTHRPG